MVSADVGISLWVGFNRGGGFLRGGDLGRGGGRRIHAALMVARFMLDRHALARPRGVEQLIEPRPCGESPGGESADGASDAGDTQPAGGDTMTDPGIDANCLSSGFNCDPVPTNAASVASDLDCSSIDPSFDDNTYIGAFAPNGENWADESNAWVDYSIN